VVVMLLLLLLCHHPLRVPVPNLFPQPLLPSVALPAHQNKNPPTHSPQILLATNKQSSRWFFCEVLLSKGKRENLLHSDWGLNWSLQQPQDKTIAT
jgi:hypothetical protein